MARFRSLANTIGRQFVFTVAASALFLLASTIDGFAAKAEEAKGPVNLALRTAGVFEEPLVATGITLSSEDLALAEATATYKTQTVPDDFTVFDRFLAEYPQSNWRVALLTNLGLAYYHYGYFSKAIDSWEEAWKEGRGATSAEAKALVDRAVGELARMHARLGHADRLAALFQEIGDRPVSGPATESLTGATEGLWTMRNDPGVAYLCGPMALKNLLLSENASAERVRFLDEYRSSPQGVTLAEVGRLAEQAKLPYKLAYREKNQPIPVPAIVHWKVSHFAVVIGETNGRFHIKDPTFGTDLWVTRGALESESSGYFLIPSEKLGTGLREVGFQEASNIRGMGFTGSNDPSATSPSSDTAMPQSSNCGMCGYNVSEMVVSLNLKDTPVGYAPPKGPPVYMSVIYNQREASQPANFSFFNVSAKWTLNWLSYIQDDPTLAGANVLRYVAGGGYVNYLGYDSSSRFFFRETTTKVDAFLQLTSNSPISYSRYLPDGSVEIYSQSDGATTFPRRVFLSQISDPAGNVVKLNYDNQQRLVSITDATGRNTTLSYELTTNPLLVTRITDPFDHSAQIAYDANGRLAQITDVIGLTSRFTYDSSSLVNSMTTPYGTTTFAFGTGVGYGPSRFVEITDPLGNHERVEYLQGAPGISSQESPIPNGIKVFHCCAPDNSSMFMDGRNTFYWDKHALLLARGDYTKARIRHWLHDGLSASVQTSSVIESVKYPLERRIWFNYPGQGPDPYGGGVTGNLDKPSVIARVLDDGTTQLTQLSYNFFGKLASVTDPVGRATFYDYDPSNGVDLLSIRQQTSPTVLSNIARFTYNSQRLPVTYTDAAGQTTTYSYNSAGQLSQVANPLNETTEYVYDGLGYLTRVINPNGKTAASFTYDASGRVATHTDSEGYTVSFAYDAADRLTIETYPDGTTRQYTWNRLDLSSVKDRQGRTTQYSYDAVRDLIAVTDPLGRKTKFGYYENGKLKTLTDPNGNVTTWNIDVQDRVTAKVYADGKQFTNTYEASTSRLKSVSDPLGQTKQYGYALDDQMTSINYLNAHNPTPNVNFAYDTYFRRLVSMTDGSGTTQYEYQVVGALGALHLLKEVGPYKNSAIAYQYDATGRMIGREVDTTSTENFGYDKLGRLTLHASPLGTFALDYLGQTAQPTSRRLSESLSTEWTHEGSTHDSDFKSGPVRTEWTYDSNKQDRHLLRIKNGGEARNYHLTTTPEKLITHIDETGAERPHSWSYVYDAAGRLIQASSNETEYAYAYDPADNIVSIEGPAGTKNGNYNNVNQVLSFNDESFTYDANGNVIDDGVRTYEWDAENRLLNISNKNELAKSTTFRYDGYGRRIAILNSDAADSKEKRYLWCGVVLCQARDSNDVVSRRYFPEGELVVRRDDSEDEESSKTTLYYAQDQLGSVRDVLTGVTGHTTASFDYDPYGNPTRTDGHVSPDFRYARMFYEKNSGLYLTQYRAYDPRTSRFISNDPLGFLGGSLNLYAYVKDSPVNLVDRNGAQVAGEPGWEPGYEPAGNPLFDWLSDEESNALNGYLGELYEQYYFNLEHAHPSQSPGQQCLINPPGTPPLLPGQDICSIYPCFQNAPGPSWNYTPGPSPSPTPAPGAPVPQPLPVPLPDATPTPTPTPGPLLLP
ncbi:MAG TPA: RHS repeat-associated core domain-containing protein [Terriglobales bacterium]|jgi:RHS repeat-associated protein|nr:RHS repeat-associated core domain-containing protein [Terriglobales bacterium]